jgi:glycosyltransferase involved in cell wall biosynthesis
MMRIHLIGDFSPALDEGYKNTSFYLARELERRHRITRLNGKQVTLSDFWSPFLASKPDIIHILSQPTNRSFLFLRLLQLFHADARVVVSALRVERFFANGEAPLLARTVLAVCRPDLILVQSAFAARSFKSLGWEADILPNGVDLDRFTPVTAARKAHLRVARGLDPQRTMLLHVGHLRRERNLLALAPLARAGLQVVIVASPYIGIDAVLHQRLEQAGIKVLMGYDVRIEESFQMADCYVFPVRPGDSLSMPLSILEAMASNLPVVTTRFAGLVEAFEEGRGLIFVKQDQALLPVVQELLRGEEAVDTRALVSGCSWQSVADKLQFYYERVLSV